MPLIVASPRCNKIQLMPPMNGLCFGIKRSIAFVAFSHQTPFSSVVSDWHRSELERRV